MRKLQPMLLRYAVKFQQGLRYVDRPGCSELAIDSNTDEFDLCVDLGNAALENANWNHYGDIYLFNATVHDYCNGNKRAYVKHWKMPYSYGTFKRASAWSLSMTKRIEKAIAEYESGGRK